MTLGLANAALLFEHGLGINAIFALAATPPDELEEDTLVFEDEAGGTIERTFGVPSLPGMDEIEVVEAAFTLAVRPREMAVGHEAIVPSGEHGIVVALARDAALAKVVLSYDEPPPAGRTLRLMVRPATAGAAGFTFGPPIFAHPAFPAPGPMYGPVLGGLTVWTSGRRRTVILPDVPGRAWLIQLAHGNTPTEITTLDVRPGVESVSIRAVPTDLAVVLQADDGPVTLWSHPDRLLARTLPQPVDFTPLARRSLAAKLAGGQGAAPPGALGLPLQFTSSSGGAAAIVAKTLSARYLLRPLAGGGAPLRLAGERVPLVLAAPGGLRAAGSSVRATLRSLGRELNDGSSLPPAAPPADGLVLLPRQRAAVRLRAAPRAGGGATDLVSIQLYLAALEPAEAVVELRDDAAGGPGAGLAQGVAVQLAIGPAGWVEFPLPAPLALGSGARPLWISLRVNVGRLLWFAADDGTAETLASDDEGETWRAPATPLAAASMPLAQLFHATPDPQPAPRIELWQGGAPVAGDLLGEPRRIGPREHAVENAALPAVLLDRLAAASGSGRVATTFQLFSRPAIELTFEDVTLFYAPTVGAAAASG